MKKWKISLCAAPVLTVALAGAAVQNLLKRRERKSKRLPPLWTDPICHLAPADVGAFVEEEIFPRSAEIVSALDENDRRSASLLLSSLIGFLVEIAPDNEKDLPTLMVMLDNCRPNYNLKHTNRDPVGLMMRDEAKRECTDDNIAYSLRKDSVNRYYMDYQRFHLVCKRQRRVIESCRLMVYDLAAPLYSGEDVHAVPPSFDDELGEFDDLLGSDELEEMPGCG